MRWLYTVSPVQLHDLRNRLTVVKGMAQLLARQIARADWQRDRVVYRVDCLQSAISDLEVVVQALARDHIERQPDTTGDVFPEQY